MPKKLVIIPTYNELENIQKIISKVFSLEEDFDILVVDDGSPDGTAQIVKSIQEEHKNKLFIEERSGKLGLGTAIFTVLIGALQGSMIICLKWMLISAITLKI